VIPDVDRPHELVDALLAPLPSGSRLALTHTTDDLDPLAVNGYVRAADDLDPLAVNGYVRAATDAGMVFTRRTKPEVERFFHTLDLVSPGVVPVLTWHPDGPRRENLNSVHLRGCRTQGIGPPGPSSSSVVR
jgi:hypothetical protein